MKFEIGKYYQHSGLGLKIAVLTDATTTLWGRTLIAETSDNTLRPVGKDDASAINWHEIAKSEWEKEFSK